MIRLIPIFGLAVLFTANLVRAQDMPAPAKPTEQHQWLKRFEGNWSVKQSATMGPGQPPIEGQGTIESTMLGDFWVINRMTSKMMGTRVTGMQTIGYDRAGKKFIGTWVDSMTETIWHYEGELDESGDMLTLGAEGPNMAMPGKTSLYQDIYQFKSDDEIVLTSKMQTDDGDWVTFMTGTATRIPQP